MPFRDDFQDAELPDPRLTKRLVRIAEKIAAHPAAGFPEAAGSDADAEAMYRFWRNPRVTPDAVIEAHLGGTATRAQGWHAAGSGDILVAHDTTVGSFSTSRKGLGPTGEGGDGLFIHVALVMGSDQARTPLGLGGVSTHVRGRVSKKQKHTELVPPEERESYRWSALFSTADERLPTRSAVHLMDSEADTYLLLERGVVEDRRFIVRATHDRRLETEEGVTKLSTLLSTLEGRMERQVELSARAAPKRGKTTSRKRNLGRETREATLQFSAQSVTLRSTERKFAKREEITLNVVHVREINAPSGTEPVSWILYTTEPIGTLEEIARVVDYYRARWCIEELFKALKTGCAFEERQLESLQTISVALAVLLPIACDLLALRALSRSDPKRPARLVLAPMVLKVLELHERTKLRPGATIEEAMMAIGRFGGLLQQNGRPGWIVLGRGYRKILTLAEGMAIGMKLNSKR